MPSYNLPDADRETPFSNEDRIMHTTKYAERSFDQPIDAIGTVEMRGKLAVLVVTVDGVAHELAWARQPNGHIMWFTLADSQPLPAGPSSRALTQIKGVLAQK